jgi:hypothetical protein
MSISFCVLFLHGKFLVLLIITLFLSREAHAIILLRPLFDHASIAFCLETHFYDPFGEVVKACSMHGITPGGSRIDNKMTDIPFM